MTDEQQKVGESAPKNRGNAGKGRKKGVPNKLNASVKEAIIEAAKRAGGEGGMVAYLEKQAHKNPTAFMSILGRVVPMQTETDGNITVTIKTFKA
jgi:hypothetical protein